jgi:uncharacterized protein YciI
MQKSATVLILVILFLTAASAQEQENQYPNIKQYFFVMLTRGPKATEIDSVELEKIQAGHMANIHRMAETGKLKIAGPFGDDGNWRGIFIFDVSSEEEVKELISHDPAIQSGRLSYEIHPWWSDKEACLK